jgi:hypothetical protein
MPVTIQSDEESVVSSRPLVLPNSRSFRPSGCFHQVAGVLLPALLSFWGGRDV